MGEEGSVGSHVHNVGIALDASHEGSLVEGAFEHVLTLGAGQRGLGDVAGILASKHLRALAVVLVVAADVLHEPLLVAVVVLVDEVGLQACHLVPAIGELLATLVVGLRTGGAYNLDLRILGTDSLHEVLEALGIERSPLLVAHADELQVEGGGVAHVGTQFTPLRIGSAVAELDEVEAVVDVGLQVGGSHMHAGGILVVVLILAGQSDVEDGQRLGTDVLRQAEQLVEAHAVGLEVVGEEAVGEGVVPAVLIQRTVLNRSHGVLPLVARGEVGALYDAAAGEAEHAGMQVLQVLNEVGTEASLPGVGGEERHVVEVDALLAFQIDAHEALGIGLRGSDLGGVFLPILTGNVDGLLGHHLVVAAHEFDANLGGAGAVGAGIDGELIAQVLLQTHAEVAVVLQSGELLAVAVVLQHGVVGIAVEGGVGLSERDVAEHVPALQAAALALAAGRDVQRSLEGAILHELGIKAAVGTEVDVLEEDAVHRGLYGSPRLGVEHQLALCVRRSKRGKRHHCHCKNLCSFHYY